MDPDADYPDYPAAHSADTEWFAVDADGHVARFYSGEEGAIPLGAAHDPSGPDGDLMRRLAGALPPPLALPPGPGGPEDRHRAMVPDAEGFEARLGYLHDVLMFLDGPDLVREAVDQGWAHVYPAEAGVAVHFLRLDPAPAARLHEAGACLGCVRLRDLGGMAGALGLFRYAHDDAQGCAAPYDRGAPPARPLTIDRVPPDLREFLGQLQFDALRFADSPRLQPADHANCEAWGRVYINDEVAEYRPLPRHATEPHVTRRPAPPLTLGDAGESEPDDDIPF